MIPIRLEIQGLYSYQEKQVVDFEQLTAAGLFGIFGAVGSGKSSILEAVLLALYGSTERLSVTGERNSMVNLQSDQLLVALEFKAGKGNATTYLARYAAKRNKKNSEKIDSGEHVIYEKINEDWAALSKSAEEVIGMKKEHFKQTVIIPQGKFREFIDLKPRDQADMMKELFGLQRFDLSKQTGGLIAAVKEELIRLETKLESLTEVDATQLQSKKEAKTAAITQLEALQKNWEEKEQRFRAQEKLREKKEELNRHSLELQTLLDQKPAIEAKKKYHSRFLTAKNKLLPTWQTLKSLHLAVEKNQVSAKKCADWVITYREEIEGLEKDLAKLLQLNQDRPNRESKIRDLKQVLDIKAFQSKLQQAKAEVENLEPTLQIKKEEQKQLQKQIKTLENETASGDLPNASTLAKWKSWLWESQQNQSQLAKISAEKETLETALTKLDRDSKEVKSAIPDGLESLLDWEKQVQQELDQLDQKSQKLKDQNGLAAHVHLLEDGLPCPLCGSASHPDPLSVEKSNAEILALQTLTKEKKGLLLEILALQKKKEQLDYQVEQNSGVLAQRKEELSSVESTGKQLISLIKEAGFEGKENLQKQILQAEKDLAANEKRQKEITEFRRKSEEIQAEWEKLDQTFQNSRKQFEQIQTAIDIKREAIRDLGFVQQFFAKQAEDIQDTIAKVEKSIREAEENLDGGRKRLEERKLMQSQNATSLDMYQTQLQEDLDKQRTLKAEYELAKARHGFTDEEELKKLFEDSLDEEKVALEIRKFEDRFHLISSRIIELKEDKALDGFDLDAFEALQEVMAAEAEHLEQHKSQLTLLDQEIKSLEKDLENKLELLKNLEKVSHRHSNLKELDVLFRGGGFVKFVSSIYLRELCNTANIRFMKLTKNQLSLDIDTNNTFWVIDYLNGGKKRLLKTLSGGQTFQASLCLALALAEKIKALNQADQSFFFMDEGFGALDKSSLGVVFDTLKSLQFENRIVGIISHVEDLQQEIGVYAKVEMDPEKGSQIAYSFS